MQSSYLKLALIIILIIRKRSLTGLAEIPLEPDHEEFGLGGRIKLFFVHNVMIY